MMSPRYLGVAVTLAAKTIGIENAWLAYASLVTAVFSMGIECFTQNEKIAPSWL